MLKIYYNEKSNADIDLKITINGLFLRVDASSEKEEKEGVGVIEAMRAYNSYSLINSSGVVKVYRTVRNSAYKMIDLNRLGVSTKMDFSDLQQLYGDYGVLQVDTGMVNALSRDIIIRVFVGKKEKITIDADMDYEILPFNSDDLPVQSHPRMTLWDSYALIVDGKELQANRKGIIAAGIFDEPIYSETNYITFEIQKYKGPFEKPLTRDIDDDEVLVESTCGVLNTRRVYLKNGRGSFRLYPLGYTGPFKIKLGRKWYEVWNEYNLIMGEA